MLDSTPTGINAKPVEVLVVHVSAALIDVACQTAAAGITKFDRFQLQQVQTTGACGIHI
jgi:heterodisulfide reductase subunit C